MSDSTGIGRPRRPPTPTATEIAASTLVLWIATAIAATAFWPVYESPRFIVMVVVTTVVASGIAVVGAVVRLQVHLVVLAVLIAYLVLGVPLAVPDGAAFGVLPTGTGLVDLAVGSAFGWKQLLTITLPVGAFQSLLVPAFIIVLATVTASASIALRARVAESAVVGPIVLFIAAIAFGPTTEFFPVALALAETGTLLLWIVWFRLRRRSAALAAVRTGSARTATDTAGPWRAAISAVLLIAIASGGALVAVAVVPPGEPRTVLRSSVVQPFEPRDYASPLSAFRRYHEIAQETATMLTVDGLSEGDRIRIATLDSYDGVVYAVGGDDVTSQSGSFTLVPFRFDQAGIDGTPVSLDVTVGAYSGVWVPTVGRLRAVDFRGTGAQALRDSFYYNDVSGTAATVAELSAGDNYRLDAVRPTQPSGSELTRLEPGDAPVPTVEGVPNELSRTLNRYVSGVDGDGARLEAAIDGLRAEGYISHGVGEDAPMSRSGHSADRITRLLTDPRMIGDEEQYAVTAALMARELGFPARVVVGFAPEIVEGRPTAVTGADISAWIEVDTASSGWVTIDPTPPEREIPEELPEDPTQVARPQQPVQPPVEEPELSDDQVPPDTVQDEPETIDPLLALLFTAITVLGWLAVTAAIVTAPFVAVIATKLRRRRRRRKAATPLDRIRGGWDEFEDAVFDHGYDPPRASTRSEFAAVVDGSRPLVLAAAADRAVFAPGGPDQEEADRMWEAVSELRRSLDAGLTRRQRLTALLSLRSFRARSRLSRAGDDE